MTRPGFEVNNNGGRVRGSGPDFNPSGGSSVVKRLSGLNSSPEEYVASRRRPEKQVDTSRFKGMSSYDVFIVARDAREKKTALEAVSALSDSKAFNWLVFLMRHCPDPAASYATDALYKRHVRPMDSPDYVEMGIVAYFVKGNRKKILLGLLKEAAGSDDAIKQSLALEGLARSKDGGLYFNQYDD